MTLNEKNHNNSKKNWKVNIQCFLGKIFILTNVQNDFHLLQGIFYENLPGEFFKENQQQDFFIDQHNDHMRKVKSRPTTHYGKKKLFIFKNLLTSTHVFVRVEANKKSLDPPYEEPYEVRTRAPKYFTIKIKEKEHNIAIDRLKPVYVEQTTEEHINESNRHLTLT
ncbi:PREDICTED: uncharacterized protein LOC108577676 [Habropoda laboriosa]|nr:PREDICTED: uncharacterized protein LOC108577676 [Habropoda laboriosa]